MRLTIQLLLLALVAALSVYAKAPQKAFVVSYPDSTSDSVIAQAKAAIKEAGGVITHEYNLIKAFAAKAPATVFETVSAMGVENNFVVEEDQMVSANGN